MEITWRVTSREGEAGEWGKRYTQGISVSGRCKIDGEVKNSMGNGQTKIEDTWSRRKNHKLISLQIMIETVLSPSQASDWIEGHKTPRVRPTAPHFL